MLVVILLFHHVWSRCWGGSVSFFLSLPLPFRFPDCAFLQYLPAHRSIRTSCRSLHSNSRLLLLKSLAGNRYADAITRPPHLPLAFAHKLTWDTSSSTPLASLPPGTTTWSPRPPLSTPNASHSSVTTLRPFPSAWQTISSTLEASHPCGRPRTLQDRERGKRACRKGKGGKGR